MEMNQLFINRLRTGNNSYKNWTAIIRIDGHNINFKLNTGTEVSVLPVKVCNSCNLKEKVQPTNIVLSAYGNKDFKIKPVAFINVLLVDTDSSPIIGLSDCMKLVLIRNLRP